MIPGISTRSLGSMARILVADSDSDMGGFIRRICLRRQLCRQVEVVEDGQTAFHRLVKIEFSLAIIDVDTPGLSGMEIVRALRQREIATKVVLIADRPTAAVAREAMWSGAQDLLEKPILLESFATTVQNLLDNPQPDLYSLVDRKEKWSQVASTLYKEKRGYR